MPSHKPYVRIEKGGVDNILNLSNFSGFISKHWKGGYPLGISFWVNFTFIILVYNGFESLVRNNYWPVVISLPVLGSYLIVTRLIIFPWQIVGLLRTCEKHFLQHGSTLWIRSIQGLVIVAIIMNAVGAIDTLQWYMQRQFQAMDTAEFPDKKSYSLSLLKKSTLIYLKGTLDFGITGEMEELLAGNSNIEAIILSSTGGIISEGRGLFRLIDQYKLNTFVYDECSSACALAFIAGNKRYIATSARLGFHQYNLQLQNTYQHINVEEAQQHDLELLRKKQVSSQFLEQIFKQPSHSIWFPTVDELVEFGVVNAVIENPPTSRATPISTPDN